MENETEFCAQRQRVNPKSLEFRLNATRLYSLVQSDEPKRDVITDKALKGFNANEPDWSFAATTSDRTQPLMPKAVNARRSIHRNGSFAALVQRGNIERLLFQR